MFQYLFHLLGVKMFKKYIVENNKRVALVFLSFAVILFGFLFFNACSNQNTINTKLSFLDNLGEHKVNYSEQEKIERIIAFYKKKLASVQNLEVKFVQKIEANKDLEFDAYVFEFSVDGEKQQEILFIKDNFFFSDFASIESLNTSKEKAIKRLEQKSHEQILKSLKEDSEYVVTLGSGDKDVYIFSDPLCPFCREHLETITEKYLTKHKVHFIFISVHQEDGFNRAGRLYDNLENSKNDKDKLEIIKLYYSDNINKEPIAIQKMNNMKMLYDKYLNLGVKYVPYIIENN